MNIYNIHIYNIASFYGSSCANNSKGALLNKPFYYAAVELNPPPIVSRTPPLDPAWTPLPTEQPRSPNKSAPQEGPPGHPLDPPLEDYGLAHLAISSVTSLHAPE
eukprot:1176673-Prorocentrum_minimum.AAC.1